MEKVVSRRRATDLLRLLRDVAIIFILPVYYRPTTVVSDSMNQHEQLCRQVRYRETDRA
jgi:hypothetical protein